MADHFLDRPFPGRVRVECALIADIAEQRERVFELCGQNRDDIAIGDAADVLVIVLEVLVLCGTLRVSHGPRRARVNRGFERSARAESRQGAELTHARMYRMACGC